MEQQRVSSDLRPQSHLRSPSKVSGGSAQKDVSEELLTKADKGENGGSSSLLLLQCGSAHGSVENFITVCFSCLILKAPNSHQHVKVLTVKEEWAAFPLCTLHRVKLH